MTKAKFSSKSLLRPPIVTILGHVDHGKTTLLDTLRKTKYLQKEVGGITQGIGASVFKKGQKTITFIDTPGHAAFSKMRSRGVAVADVAVLLVAADDGVKPQTREALSYLTETKLPFIVAISKIDLPSVNIDSVLDQLETEGIKLEGRGGDVPVVNVSAKDKKGLNELLEMIHLVTEISEIKGDPKADLKGYIIETGKDKRGVLASVVLKRGTLIVGQELMVDGTASKVRGIFDENQKSIKEVLPGFPAQIIGFKEEPAIGATISSVDGDKADRQKRVSFKKNIEVAEDEIAVIIKATNAGSLEAVIANLPEKAVVISSGVGDIIESDVFLAKPSNAYVLGFESTIPNGVRKLAQTEGVQVETFDIIYKLFEKLEEIIQSGTRKEVARAQILASFPFNKKKVAGCKMISGMITKGSKLILEREGVEIGRARATSLKKQKIEIKKASEGEEFGVILSPQIDFEIGDMLLSVEEKQK